MSLGGAGETRRYHDGMWRALKLHPDSRSAAVARIEVEAERAGPASLELRYVLTGDAGDLRLPPTGESKRTDELWRHTCFEAFVGTPGGDAYIELNFAPSTQWAAYAFDGYRRGMRPADVSTPRIEVRATQDEFQLTATVDLGGAGLPPDAPWRIGLSAVVEARGGRISYWALAHPPRKPDFHSRDCFALELPAPDRPSDLERP